MRFLSSQITFQEVPDEISLSFLITGCKTRCRGCHSAEAWDPNAGEELTKELFFFLCKRNLDFISCINFLGGEWEAEMLVELLKIAKTLGLKTCLYTGELSILPKILTYLDYAKIGPWIPSLGGLDSLYTNQKIFNNRTQEILNYRFHTKEVVFDSTYGNSAQEQN
jgi:anaerobic ribonucleoside-triphosphate reductase activating protein